MEHEFELNDTIRSVLLGEEIMANKTEIKVDNVNSPSHYKSTSFECIEVMEMIFNPYQMATICLANAFKYLWRHEGKNGKEDIQKAKWYLDRYETYWDLLEPCNKSDAVDTLSCKLWDKYEEEKKKYE